MHKRLFWTLVLSLFLSPLMAEVHYLTEAEFRQKVMDFTQYTQEKGWWFTGIRPCVVDFYTTWCGPCKRLAPIMETLSEKYAGQVDFYKVDTEQERGLAYFFQISSIPQVLYVPRKGDPMLLKGLYPEENIVEIINEFLLKKK